jgi:hypothetical protein
VSRRVLALSLLIIPKGKKEEGRGKREEGRGKREEGRGKREEGWGCCDIWSM